MSQAMFNHEFNLLLAEREIMTDTWLARCEQQKRGYRRMVKLAVIYTSLVTMFILAIYAISQGIL